jgi:IclR family transcriptional regulator, acetate operon repressor
MSLPSQWADRSASADRPARPARSGGVQSLDRAFEILELMADAGGEVALSQLASASGLPVPTIHRIVRTLVASGYVLQLPSRRYALGPRLIGIGESASRTVEAWAGPHLLALAETTGETANLAMLDGDMVVYVAQVPSSRHTVRMFTEVGRRVYAHCTGVGKALLAQLPEDEVRAVVDRAGMPAMTPQSITDVDVLLDELATVRADGHAVDDGEQENGVRCVAVALPHQPATAMSVSGPAGRVTRAAIDEMVPTLHAAAERLAGRG